MIINYFNDYLPLTRWVSALRAELRVPQAHDVVAPPLNGIAIQGCHAALYRDEHVLQLVQLPFLGL
ncbi:MAG: hypothetical protein ACYCSS_06825 [Sulfuriferula sp.]